MLQRSSVYLMNDLRVMKQIRGATIYPVFTLVLCIAITAFLLIVILPRFADIFASRQATLPLPTRMLMALSGSLVTSWHWWLAAILTVIVGCFIWTRTRLGRCQLDGLVLSVPLLSGIFHSLYQYRTFRTFSLMIEAGVPILDVVQLAQEVVPNTHYCALWKGIDTNIRNGERLSAGLLASDLIPESISQMIDSGERSGKLGVVFDRVADFVELEYNQSIKNAMQLIEPAMILGMGAIIGFIAASLMLPLFRISQVVAQ